MERNQDQVKDMPGIGRKSQGDGGSNLQVVLEPWIGSRPETRWGNRRPGQLVDKKCINGGLDLTRRG